METPDKNRDTGGKAGLIGRVSSRKPDNYPGRNRIAFLHSALPAGSATIFLQNLAGELARREIPVHVSSVADMHPLVADFARHRTPVSLGPARARIF